jgi:hypothetical protein
MQREALGVLRQRTGLPSSELLNRSNTGKAEMLTARIVAMTVGKLEGPAVMLCIA